MKSIHGTTVVILLVLVCFFVQAGRAKSDAPAADITELARVVSLTAATLRGAVKSPAEYKLIKVELTSTQGKYAWRATYKPIKLLPKDPSKEAIGVGGEVFITVDLKTEQIKVWYGE